MKVGDKVRRNTTERGYQGIGEIIEIDVVKGRARIRWEDKRTWYKMERLILVSETSFKVCDSILDDEIYRMW